MKKPLMHKHYRISLRAKVNINGLTNPLPSIRLRDPPGDRSKRITIIQQFVASDYITGESDC